MKRRVAFNERHSKSGLMRAGYVVKSEEHLGVSYRNILI